MIRKRLTSAKLLDRIICLTILFLVTFFGITIISYIVLPEGFLMNKNNVTNFDTSSNLIIGAIQIFFWNMLSVLAIVISSFFGNKKKECEEYISLAYNVYFICVFLGAITLGTWSFTNNIKSVPIFERIIQMFNIFEHAGLIELYGQLLITCSLSKKYLVMTYKKEISTRNIKDVKWTKNEIM